MTSQENKARIADLLQVVWREGDLDRLSEFWAEDCVNHAAAPPDQRGLVALRRYHEGFREFREAFSDLDIAIRQQVAEADLVVTHIQAAGRHTGEFAGLPASGAAAVLDSMRIDRLVAGKIVEHWSVADMAGLFRQLGGG